MVNQPINALVTFGDSSGNPARTIRGYKDTTHYIIVTITVDIHEAQRVDAQIQHIKEKHFDHHNIESASLHANKLISQLTRRTGNRARAEEKFEHIFDEVVEIVKNMNAVINVTIMDKHSPDETAITSNTVLASWANTSNMILQALQTAPSNTVLMILLDRYDYATNKVVERAMAPLLRQCSGTDKLVGGVAIPRPVFVDSRSCNMVQLADMIAYIVAKNVEGNTTASFAKWYDLLKPKLSHISYFEMRYT